MTLADVDDFCIKVHFLYFNPIFFDEWKYNSGLIDFKFSNMPL